MPMSLTQRQIEKKLTKEVLASFVVGILDLLYAILVYSPNNPF
jgi:hypothetical protein